MIRERLISEVGERLKANMGLIKTLIALLPLLGLLGTVTGMVQVFEAMTYSGGNARSMAAGVSAAYPNDVRNGCNAFRSIGQLFPDKSGRD